MESAQCAAAARAEPSPANKALVASSVTVKAEADDDFNVTQVAFYAGETWLGTDTTPPFSVEWHNGNLNQGPYTLTAKAYSPIGASFGWRG